jgi:hypothetical protein
VRGPRRRCCGGSVPHERWTAGEACQGRGVSVDGPGTADAGRLQRPEVPRRPTFPVVPRGPGPIVAVPGRLAEG